MAPANSWSSITSRDPLRINGFKRTKPALLFDNIGHKELSSVQELPRFNLRFGFLGTVTEMNTQSGSFKTIRMSVDRAFKGDLKKLIDLFDDGMCDGPVLQIGKQYLMYTSGDPNGPVPARGCTRSRR